MEDDVLKSFKELAEKRYKEVKEGDECEDETWKEIEVCVELEHDERYCYWDNKACFRLYVNKNWSEDKIRKYVKKNMWVSIKERF